jgi:hypothetical protein
VVARNGARPSTGTGFLVNALILARR